MMSPLWSHILFKFVLPRIRHAEIEGIRLDVSRLSPLMKNHIRTGRNEVPARSLRSLVEAMAEAPTVLICDLEGAEAYLDFQEVPGSVRKIIIELHLSVTGEAEVERILGNFGALGFRQMGREGRGGGTWGLKGDAFRSMGVKRRDAAQNGGWGSKRMKSG